LFAWIKTAAIYVPDQSVSDLFKQLQLESLAESDPRIRNYLTERIPALIEAGPQHYQPEGPDVAVQYPGPVWRNAVMLASELKVAEAAPALVKWVSVSTSPVTTLTESTQLTNNPAGQALIQIRDPSIPALRDGLEHGNPHERWDCTFVLVQIGSSRAIATLRDHATHEPDEALVHFINRATSR
jgi:HEAT repeat protein